MSQRSLPKSLEPLRTPQPTPSPTSPKTPDQLPQLFTPGKPFRVDPDSPHSPLSQLRIFFYQSRVPPRQEQPDTPASSPTPGHQPDTSEDSPNGTPEEDLDSGVEEPKVTTPGLGLDDEEDSGDDTDALADELENANAEYDKASATVRRVTARLREKGKKGKAGKQA